MATKGGDIPTATDAGFARIVMDRIESVPARHRSFLTILSLLASTSDGRGIAASWTEIAYLTGLHYSTVGRRMDELERLGLLRRGDQSVAYDRPAGQRPVVYDIVMPPDCGDA